MMKGKKKKRKTKRKKGRARGRWKEKEKKEEKKTTLTEIITPKPVLVPTMTGESPVRALLLIPTVVDLRRVISHN